MSLDPETLRHYLDHGTLALLLFLAGVTFHRCHLYHHDHKG